MSVLLPDADQFSEEHTPRALKFLTLVHPTRVSPLFRFMLPKEADADVPRFEAGFWHEAHRLIDSFARHVDLSGSPLFAQMKLMVETAEHADDLKLYMSGKEEEYYALSFLGPSDYDVPAPAKVRKAVCMVVRQLNGYFEEDPEVAQDAMTNLVFAVARFEMRDLLVLARDDLHFYVYMTAAGVADGLMLAGCQQDEGWRRRFYTKWVRPDLQPCSYGEFSGKLRKLRHDPLLLFMLLQRMPPRYPWSRFEREFAERVYKDIAPLPPDRGRQALVFACHGVVPVWRLSHWPCLRVVQERLVELAASKWRIS